MRTDDGFNLRYAKVWTKPQLDLDGYLPRTNIGTCVIRGENGRSYKLWGKPSAVDFRRLSDHWASGESIDLFDLDSGDYGLEGLYTTGTGAED